VCSPLVAPLGELEIIAKSKKHRMDGKGNFRTDTVFLTQGPARNDRPEGALHVIHSQRDPVNVEPSVDKEASSSTGNLYAHEATGSSHRQTDAVNVKRSSGVEVTVAVAENKTHQATGTFYRANEAANIRNEFSEFENDTARCPRSNRKRSGQEKKGPANRRAQSPVVRRKSPRFYANHSS